MRLIDADALMNTLQELFEKRDKEAIFTGDRGVTVTWDDAIYHIKAAPTIEERKTGKWEEREVSSEKVIDEWQSARCSVCEKYHTTPYMYYFDDFTFCPNCGAKMRRKEEKRIRR